jgi:hypothetical protein
MRQSTVLPKAETKSQVVVYRLVPGLASVEHDHTIQSLLALRLNNNSQSSRLVSQSQRFGQILDRRTVDVLQQTISLLLSGD